ncbi:MAG: IMP dehydrogenase [Candidatus Micrarchaeia archaeon]
MGRYIDKFNTAPTVFNFEDIMILPGLSKVEPNNIKISTKFSKNIKLNIPFVSSPMDTVTEAQMAIILARLGGIGVIHRNCSTEEEVAMVQQVKRSESFIIKDVVTIDKDAKVSEATELMKKNNISGLPVVENGKLVGIITGRDVRFCDQNIKVSEAMTKDVVSVKKDIKEAEAIETLKSNRIEKLPVVDENNNLFGLITYRDIILREQYIDATRDNEGRLAVAAAISPFDLDRAKKLSKYADALLIDVAHFYNSNVISATKKIMSEVDNIDIIIGNLGTREEVLDSISQLEDVAGLRMGIGSGSICITTDVTKAGAPTLFAVSQAADALEELGSDIPIIADGGIRNPGDVAAALAFGASSAMMGYVLASCKESPSALTQIGGKYYKTHRGMGSPAARAKRMALDRYATFSKNIAEGIELLIPYTGEVSDVIAEFTSGIKAAMGYAGASNIEEMKRNARIAKVAQKRSAKIKIEDIEKV